MMLQTTEVKNDNGNNSKINIGHNTRVETLQCSSNKLLILYIGATYHHQGTLTPHVSYTNGLGRRVLL